MVRVLVTRPEPGASRTTQRLQDTGFQPILLPLTETVQVEAGAVPDDAVAVAVTSANALRHAPKALIAVLAALPCHAVGKRTAEAAREAGFLSVSEGSGDAGAMAGALAGSLSGKTIAYLCGRVRFATFEERLDAAAVHVRAVETYDTIALDYSDAAVIDRLAGQPVEMILLYSAKAAAAMRTLIERPKLHDLFENTHFFALSGRIAAALGDIPGERMQIAKEPSEEALLALLRQWR